MKKLLLSAFTVLLAVPVLAESAPPEASVPGVEPVKKVVSALPKAFTSREAADALTEDELKDLVEMLRKNSTQAEALTEEKLARATAQGLLERLGNGARVYSSVQAAAGDPSPFCSEVLTEQTIYLRLGALNGETLEALDRVLDESAARSALILDLRATPASSDFELAAEICRRFTPKGRVLFSIKRPKVNDEEILTSRSDPRWRGVVVVLVDGDTAGSGEVIAAVLRTHVRAYVIGQQTHGEAAQFQDLPLPSGKVLRVAVGEVLLPDSEPVFPGGLKPDLALKVSQEKTNELLKAGLEGKVATLVIEKERVRMNEAALVAGTNPELDVLQEEQKNKAEGTVAKAPLRDTAVQRALDFVVSVGIYEARKR